MKYLKRKLIVATILLLLLHVMDSTANETILPNGDCGDCIETYPHYMCQHPSGLVYENQKWKAKECP
jgi:hypothetical protein